MKTTVMILLGMFFALSACTRKPVNSIEMDTLPDLFPDYVGVTIPVNIAPLNFKSTDSCRQMYVEIRGKNGSIELMTHGKVSIPAREWKSLLAENAGDSILFYVWISKNEKWNAYNPFPVYIQKQPIDSHLAYRLIAPGYQVWSSMGLYERSLTDFNQQELVTNRLFPGGCMNCHSFRQNDPEHMMFHMRMPGGGTILNIENELTKLNTKTEQTKANFQYPYWHPSGNFIAYSINKTAQSFHSLSKNRIEVFDASSDLLIYDIKRNTILTTPEIASPDWFETFPAFSPDGKYMYFCSAAAQKMPEDYDKVKYNLCRIAFNQEDGSFGTTVDTLVRVKDTGQSVKFPRISPDGKYLMYTLSAYGNFSIWHKDADLYLLDLQSGSSQNMERVNSSDVESYHSWSSDSRWFVFSSRRIDGLYTRPYFAFLNDDGTTTRPFLLPQEDPDFYNETLYSFNIPELVTGAINLNLNELEREVQSPGKNVTFMQTGKK